MTQVTGIVVAPSDRIGFQRKSGNGVRADFRALCGSLERMDLYRRYMTVIAASENPHSVGGMTKLSYMAAHGNVDRMERYIAAAETRQASGESRSRLARFHRHKVQNARGGRTARPNPDLSLPDPLAHLGEVK